MKKFIMITMALFVIVLASVTSNAEELETITIDAPFSYKCDDYSLMSDEASEALVNAWKNLDTTINMTAYNIKTSDFPKFYYNTVYENAELYYVQTKFEMNYYPSTGCVAFVTPEYKTTDKQEIAEMTKKIETAFDNMLLPIHDGMSDFDKIMTVHDYIVLNYHYDTDIQNRDISIAVTKNGVCQAYALAFKYAMDKLGIDNRIVTSDEMNHMWNLVKVDDKWYHLDATYDDPMYDRYGKVDHTYALTSSNYITSIDHTGFDLGTLTADSTIYDTAAWKGSGSALVYLDGNTYFVNGNNLETLSGDVIFANLDGGDDFWNINASTGFEGMDLGCVCEHNEKIYFSTDTAIKCFDPKTKNISTVLTKTGIIGLYVDFNSLNYGKFDSGKFVADSNVSLGNIRIYEPYYNGESISIRTYVENDDVLNIYTDAANESIFATKAPQGGYSVNVNYKTKPSLFFWKDNMIPFTEKY